MSQAPQIKPSTATTLPSAAGVFLLALATLLYEILLTRIFSVTLWYHFAFMAISVAMFGMTSGALHVHLNPLRFSRQKAPEKIAKYSLLYANATLLAVLGHATIQNAVTFLPPAIVWTAFAVLTYPLMTLPFYLSGVAMTLVLSKFPEAVGKLYAVDLAGASFACLLVVPLFFFFDGFSAVVFSGGLAAFAAYIFASKAGCVQFKKLAALCAVFLLGLSLLGSIFALQGKPIFHLRVIKGRQDASPIYEKWNSFSRLNFYGNPEQGSKPYCWGLGSKFPEDRLVKQIILEIDGTAGTVITHYSGKAEELEHLRADVINLVHFLRPGSDVLVIGVGGGRDLLSALAFNQKSVTGVEINDEIIKALTRRFGDFSGHLDRLPNVRIINDEARSFVAGSKEKYDIIQVSLIDTWAATAAGGMALSENSLYTVEAWQSFLASLSDSGILSFSRWYGEPHPRELLRLVALARTSLEKMGLANPAAHMLIAKNSFDPEKRWKMPASSATLLVSKRAFSAADIETLQKVCQEQGYEIVLAGGQTSNERLAALFDNQPPRSMDDIGLNLLAPTDDCPYFFQFMPLKSVYNKLFLGEFDSVPLLLRDWLNHSNAIMMLCVLLFFVLSFTAACIFGPLLNSRKRLSRPAPALLTFSFAIGMAFMTVEIAQMQRLSVFLGHPVYSLTVILFSLLLAGGLGSLSIEKKILAKDHHSEALIRLSLLFAFVFVTGIISPILISSAQASDTLVRILISVALVSPMGFFMGMAFPLGLKLAAKQKDDIAAWFWGINGAASVCASVLTVLLSISFGIQVAYLCGAGFYLLALLTYFLASRYQS